jgi:cell volume regulation protein A
MLALVSDERKAYGRARMDEITATALVLLAIGVLLLLSALASRITRRTRLPIPLLFLALGMLAGSQGIGRIPFEDYRLAFRLGTAALIVILFDGGLNTSFALVRRWYRPAAALATVGVVVTAALIALVARALGFSWADACLLGAVVSSTDAAAVFAVLRASGVQLKKRVGVTLELESGLNDPMAVMLTLAVTNALTTHALAWSSLVGMLLEIALGLAGGFAIGAGGGVLLRRARLSVLGLYPVLTTGIAFLAFAVPTLLHGSGFLAVYLAAVILGRSELPYRTGLLRVHDAAAWFAQVGMFLLLGLLVFPADLVPLTLPAVALGLVLAFVARPLAVALCLLPFRFPWNEVLYVGWVGLRGAVPIVLATFPVLAGLPGAERVFDVVFFIVVVNSILPGATVGWVTRRLRLQSSAPPPSPALLEIAARDPLHGEVLAFHVDSASAVCGAAIADVPFPPAASALLVVRGECLVAARGATVLATGDYVYVLCQPPDRPFVQLLFGRGEDE